MSHPATASDILLGVDRLGKSFPVKKKPPIQALDNISFTVAKGRVTGLVGADGAGKTTLIRIAAGLLTPTTGTMTILGLDSGADTLELQSRIGYMPQKFGLYQDLTVAENLHLYADLQSIPTSARPERYRQLLQMTDLARYTERRAGALSGGMKQKLGLACALIKSPELLLLDEPTVGVDPVSRRELWKIVYQLVERQHIGVLVSTAYLDEAERCDQIVVLHQGQMLAQGPPDHYTAPLAGRVLLLKPTERLSERAIYTRLSGTEHIVDITIRAGQVRTVIDRPESRERLSQHFAGIVPINETEPNFEDAFMALIPRPEQLALPRGAEAQQIGRQNHDRQEVVRTTGLQKLFGSFEAVKKLSFSVRKGEIFGLLGPNGAGKSTTFRMLCGLLPASGGEISVSGYDLRKSGARARARLGYMAQQFSLYGQLTTTENLRFFGKAYGLADSRLSERLQWAFSEFSLGPWADTPAASLPGGNKQRLAMAAALLHEPDILFLDEPTSGVDPFARREFWHRINIFAEQGTTVVVTTHFMEEAEYCDRMLIMSQGASLATGTPAQLRQLAVTPDNPHPTMDDAFIALAEGAARAQSTGGTNP
ncbi:MAG: ATP-binding cassette domain-containing protein [Desulfopila sp.]